MLRRSALHHKRTAVIASGARTPFVRSFGSFLKKDTIALSVSAVEGLLQKTRLNPEEINHIVWGNVVMMTNAPNVAREIIIDLNLPRGIPAHSTSMACASGLNAIQQAVSMVESGMADVVIAGGSDSMSCAEMPVPRSLSHGLAQFVYGKKKGLGALPEFFKHAGMNPLKWFPRAPSIAERSTGKTMGWHADMMAEINAVTRAEQEAFAVSSHAKAVAARKKNYFSEEIVACDDGRGKGTLILEDNLMKDDSDMMSKIQKMKPAFRKPMGTVTAASSSPLTDGASAVLVMSEEKAKALGYPTDIRMTAWAYTAIDPYPQLLLAPALGWHRLLKDTKLTLDSIDLLEIHEAFAAQVLTTIKCMESDVFAKNVLGLEKSVSEGKKISLEKVNVNGGSIALGHPFAATGGRCVMSVMNELRRSEKKSGLISICAAGGLGMCAIIERVPQNVPAGNKK